MRRGLAALLAVLLGAAAPPAGAGEAQAGRIGLRWSDDGWRLTAVQEFDVAVVDGVPVRGQAAVLHYRNSEGQLLASLLLGSTWNESGLTMGGTCKGDARVYVRLLPVNGFVTYGCAMAGPAITKATALTHGLKRLGPAAQAAAMPLPARGHTVTVLVTTREGGVVLIDGFVDPSLVPPNAARAADPPAPAGIPSGVSAFTDLLASLAVDAATSVFPKFPLPELRSLPAAPSSSRQ